MTRGFETSEKEEGIIRELLAKATLPRDALPYTDEFLRLKQRFAKRSKRTNISDADFWKTLVRIGKRGGLKREKGRGRAPRGPTLTVEQRLEIIRLMPDGVGIRDNLPYTPEFDRIHRQFTRLTGVEFTKHEFWRAVSRVAKASRKPKPIFDAAPTGDLPPETVEVLETTNPWWRGELGETPEIYRRWAFDEAWRKLKERTTPVVAIRGPRQVGKTMIQRQLIEHLLLIERVGPERIMRVQFDDVPGLGSLKQPVLSIVRWFEKQVLGESLNEYGRRGKPVCLFFDEVQNLKTWAPQLKFLVDHFSARTLITGSSSLRILRGQDSLAGRLSVIELGPLRLSEIAGVRKLNPPPVTAESAVLSNWTDRKSWLEVCASMKEQPRILSRAFGHFSELGGYPICHKAPRANRADLARIILDTVVERTIEHDELVDPTGQTWDKRVLRETFRLICRYIGQSVKPERMSEEIGQILESPVTTREVSNAVQFFVDAMLVHRVEPLEALKRKRPNGDKLCLCDHFVREAWLQEQVPLSPKALKNATEAVSTLAGHVMESVIGYYLKGIPGLDVSWLPERRNKKGEVLEPEVDYVLTIGLHRVPIEVKYRRGIPTHQQMKGLASFCGQKKYAAPFGLLITQDTAGPLGEHVIAVPARAFLSVL